MGTFAMWLHDQEQRDDDIGAVARWWAGDAAVRPRYSSPSGIGKWLDKQLREGSLSELEDAEKGRMRTGMSAAVNEYHDRGNATGRPPVPAIDDAEAITTGNMLIEFMTEAREQLRMLRHGQNRIMAALGLDTPLETTPTPETVARWATETAAQVTQPALIPDPVIDIPAGRREALAIRARMGDEVAAAELASDGSESHADGLAGVPEGDRVPPAPAGWITADQALGLQQLMDSGGELASGAWDFLHSVADHAQAASTEGMPDDYAA